MKTLRLLLLALTSFSLPASNFGAAQEAPVVLKEGTASVQSAGRGMPYMNLRDGSAMQVQFVGDKRSSEALRSGQAQARALASADFDRNGTPDLVAGYSYNGVGLVTIQRGNPDAFAPSDESVFARMQQGYNPDALLSVVETYSVPAPVDFVEVGDFNHDNRKDVLVATRGGGLFLMAGDGQGGLSAAEQIELPGPVTSLAAGEFRAPDGWTDLAVGISGQSGAELLIYDGASGVAGEPMRFALPAPATAVEFGEMDSSPFQGVAVATGSQIEVIHGWGRKQSPSLQSQIEMIDAGANVRGLAVGFFLWSREASKQIAALGQDGTIRIFHRGGLNDQLFSDAEIAVRARGRQNQTKTQVDVETVPGWQATESWGKAREVVTGKAVGADATSGNLLKRAHISFVGTDELLVLGTNLRLDIVRQVDATAGAQAKPHTVAGDMVVISLDTTAAPAAVLALPQKLNGERSLLLIQAGRTSPTLIPQAPTAVITVDRTDDPSGGSLAAASVCSAAANDCSLRGAVQFANAHPGTTISLGSATYTLNTNGAGGCVTENATTGNTIGDLEINETTTVTGTGEATTIIRQLGTGDGGNHPGDRVICMDVPLTSGKTFSFSALTITGGRDANVGMGNGGGGILGGAKGTTLNLTNVTFANNQASGAGFGGGGATVTGGNMNVTNCTFGAANLPGASRTDLTLGNAAGTSGGGLAYTSGDPAGTNGAIGTLTVTGTTFTHNTAAGIGGGGLDVFGLNVSTPTVNVSTSSFTSNQGVAAATSGGGMINEAANVTLATTSFTSNSVLNRGGALYVGGGTTLLDGTNPSLTFSSNSATSGGTSISTASALNVAGTNTTIGGSVEVTAGGVWTTNTGTNINPTDIVIAGGTMNCNNSTMNITGNLTLGPSGNGLFGGTFNGNTGTVNLSGNLTTNTGGSGPSPSFTGGTNFNFVGTGAQSTSGTLSPTFVNLTVNKTNTLTLGVNSSVTGNLTVTAGNFDLGAFTVNRSAPGGTLTVSNGATLKIGGTNSVPTNYSTHSVGATSTIEYSGTNQTVSALNSGQSYGNLTISGSGTKTLGGAISVVTKLLIAAGTLDVSASNFALGIAGDFTNNVAAANFNPRAGTVTFNGVAAQNINGSSTSHTFNSLTSNRTGTGNLTLGSNTTVNGVLTLTNGIIATGANTLSIGSAGTRSRTSGYVLGNEKKTYGGAGSFTFDVGTANGYSPVDSTITAGTGDLTVLAVQGAQPNVVSNRSLQRYWTLTEGGAGITANLVFHYLDPSDVMGTESNYQVLQVTGGTRNYFTNSCPAPCVDGMVNAFTVNGITSFSDFTAGEARADLQITSVADAPDPVIVGNNITYTINLINNGPDTSTNATVIDAVPANTTFVSASFPAGWSRTDSVPGGGTGNIVFTKGSVTSAETAALQMVVKVNSNAVGGSTITDTATAASVITTDPTPGNNSGTATTLVHTPPSVTSANNVTFVVGSAGSFTITTTGFPTPSIARGGVALPAGVSFTSNGDGTGTLSGTPAAGTGGTYAITFTATNAAGSSPAQSFTLTVNQAPALTSANTTTFTVGTSGMFVVTASGFPSPTLALTSGTLPSGVTFNPVSGILSGTPGNNTYGTYALVFTASNGVGSNATQNFSLIVNPSASDVKSKPSISENAGGGFRVAFIGNPGVAYTVQYSPSLITPNWQTLELKVADPQGAFFSVDTPPAGTSIRFYRAIIP